MPKSAQTCEDTFMENFDCARTYKQEKDHRILNGCPGLEQLSDETSYLKGDAKEKGILSTSNYVVQNNKKGDLGIEQNDVSLITKVRGKTGMIVDGQIEGTPISWKIDTGAGRTFITEETYLNILPDSRPSLRPLETKFTTANGSGLDILGIAVMTLSFDDFCVDFPVIVGGVSNNLLGEDFIKVFRCHWDWDTSSLEINGYNIPFSDGNEELRSSRVIALETIVVPAKHEVVVRSSLTRRVNENLQNVCGVLSPEKKFIKKYGLALARVLVNASQGIVYARLFNATCTDTVLYKGTHIALFVPVLTVGDPIEVEIENVDVCHIKEDDSMLANKLPQYMENMFQKGIEYLSDEEAKEFKGALIKYKYVFADPEGKPGQTMLGMHSIKLENETPIKEPPRRIPLFKRQVLEDEIKKLERKGIIEKSCSPWSAPIVLVQKKDSSWRLCVDYRRLNDKTIKDAYPIPRVEDNLDTLSGSKWFSSLDLDMAYHQIPVDPRDREKTAFATPMGGLYQYTSMPFVLCNAASTFQRVIEAALSGLQWHIAVLYLDDIIVLGKDFKEHLENLCKIMDRLQMAGLKLKPKKCTFFRKEVQFLGHVVSCHGVKTDPKKVEAVTKMKPPQNVKELRSFLGLISYYRKFIRNFSSIAKCLFELTKSNAKWNWTEECNQVFKTLKDKLVTSPILSYPNVDGGEFILDTDASHLAIGAVLSQVQDGREKVIAYGSRTLNKPEVNYCVTRKELLAVVYFVKYFKHYLLGRKFTLRTDHGSLTWLYRFREPDGQISRWIQQLSAYEFKIQHRPGRKHGNADAMSRVRIQDNDFCTQCKLPWDYMFQPSSAEGIASDTKSPTEGNSPSMVGAIDNRNDESKNEDQEPKKRGRRPNVPKRAKPRDPPDINLTPSIIRKMQEDDTELGEILKLKTETSVKPTCDSITSKSPCFKHWIQKWELLDIKNEMLCYYWEDNEQNKRWKICTPKTLQSYVLWHVHDSPVGGHQGISRTRNRARQCPFYWPNMNQAVKDYVQTCDICEERKQPPRRKRHQMKSYIMGARFERLASDIAGPFPTTERGNSYILVIQDYFTKFIEVYPLKDIESETVADVLLKGWIKRYGCPVELHTDQGTQYESQLFKGLCKLLNISKTRTTPAHPRSDGMEERGNRTIKEMLAKYINKNQDNWDLYLDFVVMAYNATPHDSTDITPYRMVFGDEMRLPLDIVADALPSDSENDYRNEHYYVEKIRRELERVHKIARVNLQRSTLRQKEYYDRNIKEIKYSIGDLVRRWQPQVIKGAKRKLGRNWTGPWVIIEKLTDVLFKIKHSKNSPAVIIHADNLKPYRGEISPTWYKPHKTNKSDANLPDLQFFESDQTEKIVSDHENFGEIARNEKSEIEKAVTNTKSPATEPQSNLCDFNKTDASELPPNGVTPYKEPTDGATVPKEPSIHIQRTRLGRVIRPPLRYQ